MEVKRMKKFKNVFMVFALALVLTLAAGVIGVKADDEPGTEPENPVVTETPAATEAAATETTINAATLDLENYYIVIEGTGVYYQTVKKAGDEKAKNWLPAAAKDGKSYIDVSGVTKSTVFAFALESDAAKAVGDVFELNLNVGKVKATLDYKKEAPVDIKEALATVEITVGKDTTKYIKGDDKNGFDKIEYTLEWKKGANGAWVSDEEGFDVAYQAMKSSTGTLYVRTSKAGELPSKEVKVKLAKVAAAPNVKVDYLKGTIAIKAGMEFVYGDKTYYATGKKSGGTATTSFAETEQFSDKGAKEVTVDELVKTFEIEAKADVTLKVRTSATDKKFASYYTVVTFKAPAAAPEAFKITIGEGDKISFDTEETTYEYCVDLKANKWKAIPAKAAKITGVKKDTKIYVRVKGTKEDTKKDIAGVFPSAYVEITVTEEASGGNNGGNDGNSGGQNPANSGS
jgi:hypothetical protein